MLKSTRRNFIRQAAAVTAAMSLGSIGATSSAASGASAPKRRIGRNDIIRIGVAGVNSRGRALTMGFAKFDRTEITCICDCDLDAAAKCVESVEEITGAKPAVEQDYRKMLERSDVDVVVIAMPDHWHATAAIMALNAGKHVYLEKPASYCPEENDMLLRAEAAHPGLVITVGTQRRSFPNMVAAVEELRSGAIGEIHYAKSWYTASRTGIGVGRKVPVPANLNWEFWQGPSPKREYRDNVVHYNWHWFLHWGTGEALNNGTHFIDLLRWGMGVDDEFPTLVTSSGGKYHYRGDDWEFPDTQLITFQFGDKCTFSWEGRSRIPAPVEGMSCGVAFYGDKGVLYSDGSNSYRVCDMSGRVIKEVKSDLKVNPGDRFNPSEQLDAIHFRNFLDTVRGEATLNATLRHACYSTQCLQLGNIAHRVGHSLTVDPLTGKCYEADGARLMAREYDPSWAPKVL